MRYFIYYADELLDSLNDFNDFIQENTEGVIFNPELSELNQQPEVRKTLIIFLSDNLLKSTLIGRILQINLDSFDIFVAVVTDGKINNNGSAEPIKTRISNLHELMQYRDYWYEEWIRLRKLNAIDPGMISENLIEQTRKISGEIAILLKNIAAYKPIDFPSFEKDHYKILRDLCGIELKQTQEDSVNLVETAITADENIVEKDTEILNSGIYFSNTQIEVEVESKVEEEVFEEVEINSQEANEEFLFNEVESIQNIKQPQEPLVNMQNENETLNAEQLFELAIKAKEENDFLSARNYLEQLIRLEPMNGKALRNLAVIIDLHFENESADELFRKAFFCHEEDAALYCDYGHYLSRNPNELQKAVDMYQRAIEMDETNALSYLELAHCQLKIGQKTAAKANYLQACLINSDTRTIQLDSVFGVYNPAPISDQKQEAESEILKNPNDDTVVLVTGASSGIGKAIAELFAMNGYKVIITGRRNERLDLVKEEFLNNYSAQVESLCFDIRDEQAVQLALENLPENWKNIDILINNAGLAKGRAPIHLGNLNHWETMIDTNIKGLLYISRLVSHGMVERQKGFIVNIGSIAGKEAYTDGNVYCATKAAVEMLTRGMRLDLHKYGIRVAAVHPGHVETEFALVRFDGDEQKADIYGNFAPLTAMDVAETVYYIVNRPLHVNIQDVLMFSTQQASATVVDMSGKKY
jgi:NADP-dependent 3-hydroxy acid dehydrogenase YdfG